MEKFKPHLLNLLAALLFTLFSGQAVLADDTEVLLGPTGQLNVLFIMDTSGSMGTVDDADADPRSRLGIVQDVFEALMNDESYWGINVSLMRFDNNAQGGYFVSPMQELNSSTRTSIIEASNTFTAGGGTPLSESLYEAARFFRGISVDYGDSSSPGTNHAGVFSGSNYISPITSQCQTNTIVLLTDGVPTSDSDANSNIETLIGNTCSGNCLDELSNYLYTTDQSSISGTQKVITSTIGFTTNQTLLENTATNGGGTYMTANNDTQLRAAFKAALNPGSIEDANNTFSPPAMAANAFNNISHTNNLYFTLFEPSVTSNWVGNVKPYKLTGSPPQLTDANEVVAIDSQGIFTPSSVSFWSANGTADGGSVVAGGANSQLPSAASRNVYTYTGTYSDTGIPQSPADSRLSHPSNGLTDTNSSLIPAMLGLTDSNVADTVINTTRASTLADPLHSKPALVTYGGTESNPDVTLFVATNGGFLHAIDASTNGEATAGEEQFAFIPQELLPNLAALADNAGAHPYGLDGDVTAWVKESDDADHTIETGDGDHVYVYVGMRRGGSNYYALDVTNRDVPRLKWVIKGGVGGTTGFSELGQTWSRPEVTTIKSGSSTKTVLIFGGGYDTDQDNAHLDADGNVVYGVADNIGRAIYIVDANTGEKLWQAGPAGSDDGSDPDLVISTMTNSIPSDVRLLDSDLDGHTDRLYVGDMHGQIFRIDLQTTDTGFSGSGIRLANLGGTDAANDRRFYYPPDVVIAQQPGSVPYVAVNIGSGYRAHPLNPASGARVNDRFYSLRDPGVLGAAPSNFSAITNSDLFNATSDLESTASELEHGWYITLGNGNGEKVLSSSITLNGEIFFTTYTPPEAVADGDCSRQLGTGTLYRVSLFDAKPTLINYNDDGDVIAATVGDRTTPLARQGIPSSPTVMFRETFNDDGTSAGVKIIHCEGTECEELPDSIKMEETYWRD